MAHLLGSSPDQQIQDPPIADLMQASVMPAGARSSAVQQALETDFQAGIRPACWPKRTRRPGPWTWLGSKVS